ncbi:MAG: uracil-DNA glycosylase family protein [Acidimicrobiia bacterium]
MRTPGLPTREVPGQGPYTAKMLLVGEAPGNTEVKKGIPFVGRTGQYTRGILNKAGLDVSKMDTRDVRFTNVIPFNPGTIATQAERDQLVATHWDNIANDLARMKPYVVVACGGAALKRLTGMSNIKAEHGGVIPAMDLPTTTAINGKDYELGHQHNYLVIPCLHPAGIMQTGLRAESVQVKQVLERAARYTYGELVYAPVEPDVVNVRPDSPNEIAFAKMLARSETLVIDTEFNEQTKIPYLVGVLGDCEPTRVYSMKPDARLMALLSVSLDDPEVLKVAHSFTADADALGRIGVNAWAGPWWCTLLGFNILYPDVNVGLSYVARYYLDDVRNWKDMDHEDPRYNARDVFHDWRVFQLQRDEISRAGMMDLFYDEVMPTAPLMWRLEEDGIQIDGAKQDVLLKENMAAREGIKDETVQYGASWHEARCMELESQQRELEGRIETLDNLLCRNLAGACSVHPNYYGQRGKRWADDPDCCCRSLFDIDALGRRLAIGFLKTDMRAVRNKAKELRDRGFNPGNNHDLKWLLYEGLKLPPQYDRKTRSTTVSVTAVAQITTRLINAKEQPTSKYHRDDADEIVRFLKSAKELQHLEKMESTFLRPPVDAAGVAHPPYRMWGTGTGRPAGGSDDNLADKSSSRYSFNALNVPRPPERVRELFVPHRSTS